jgi:hypothetical protein
MDFDSEQSVSPNQMEARATRWQSDSPTPRFETEKIRNDMIPEGIAQVVVGSYVEMRHQDELVMGIVRKVPDNKDARYAVQCDSGREGAVMSYIYTPTVMMARARQTFGRAPPCDDNVKVSLQSEYERYKVSLQSKYERGYQKDDDVSNPPDWSSKLIPSSITGDTMSGWAEELSILSGRMPVALAVEPPMDRDSAWRALTEDILPSTSLDSDRSSLASQLDDLKVQIEAMEAQQSDLYNTADAVGHFLDRQCIRRQYQDK